MISAYDVWLVRMIMICVIIINSIISVCVCVFFCYLCYDMYLHIVILIFSASLLFIIHYCCQPYCHCSQLPYIMFVVYLRTLRSLHNEAETSASMR